MGIFSRKKATPARSGTTGAGRAGTQGADLIVNPSEHLQLKRLEGRIRTIRLALQQNDYYTPEKRQRLEDSLRRYEVTLILKKGGKV